MSKEHHGILWIAEAAPSVPVPDALRAGLGAAQLYAAIGGARERYGLEALTVLPPSRRTRLDADERRLLADVPPHFGRT